MRAGVYEILNTKNGKRYIGSASSFTSRWSRHRCDLKRGTHHSRFLQRAWNKYGAGAFKFSKLLICAPANLIMYEQACVAAFKPEYNSHPVAGSPLGFKHPPEFGAAISARLKGTKHPPEFGAAIRARQLGRPLSEGHREKLSKAHKGKTLSTEHREKLSAAGRGRKHSAAECERAADVRRGKAHPMKTQRNKTLARETHCLLEWAR